MRQIALADARERENIFRIAAEHYKVLPALIEKDFWVCWMLERLFGLTQIAPHLVFKGGTTLSKVYGVIERFSEDIDISVSRSFVRPGVADAAEADEISKTRRRKEIEALVASFHETVTGVIQPLLHESITAELGGVEGWKLEQDDRDAGTLNFAYPMAIGDTSAYNKPIVKIEMGGRSDVWPEEDAKVTSYAAQSVPQAFRSPEVAVRVLAAERTFWEKATLLHNEYYRPQSKARGDRISRHYYDLAQMSRHPQIGPRAKSSRDILRRVVEHKTIYYNDSWSHYDEAETGKLHLLPPPEAVNDLRSDFARMRGMFFNDPPRFETLLEELARLEGEVNEAAG